MTTSAKNSTRAAEAAFACMLALASFAGLGGARGAAADDAAAAAVEPGRYRAVLTLPGGDLPFGLKIAHANGAFVGYLINGSERLKLSDVAVTGNHIEIGMPGYENHLVADADGGRLTGEIVLDKLGGKLQHIPLHADAAQDYRFFPAAAAAKANVAGRWKVTFTEDDGKSEVAVGEFKQSGDAVTGTVLTATGDHRFLAGQVHGGKLFLSTFDGAHAFLYEADILRDGTLSGDFWSGTAYHERFAAQRDAHAALPNAYALTTMRPGSKKLDFAFPDLTGTSVTSRDPRFQGKVLVVALAGSWCPNCHDEAAFLSPLYRQYRGRGLEIVSLMFEHFGDFEHAAQATQRFRRLYGIEYTTLIAGISDKDDAAKKLPALQSVNAFPTTIFIDRNGDVRKIHTGFSGPATGVHYTQFVDEFKTTVDQLLAER